MDGLCTSETFLSTPLLISPDLQDELFFYFWDIPINTTTDLTWSTIWTIFVVLRHFHQHHYWSHLIYNMDGLCSSETFPSTPLLISPDLEDEFSLYFWDIPINTTTDLTWSTIWTVFVLLRHFYQHHYWSHLIYKMDCLCTSETFISTPQLISPDLQDELALYFWDIPFNTTTDLTWPTR
jgi:predicted Abi (CAAX) family protease